MIKIKIKYKPYDPSAKPVKDTDAMKLYKGTFSIELLEKAIIDLYFSREDKRTK
jgi:hypothetical protein